MKIKVSSSMLRNVAKCSTLAMSNTAGYSLKEGGDDRKTQAGHSAHVALEHWLQGQVPEACEAAFLADFEAYSNAYIEAKSPYYHENLLRILNHFFATHAMDAMPFEVVATEREIEAQLVEGEDLWGFAEKEAEVPVILVDRADGLVANRHNGSLWAMEHKTTGSDISSPMWVNQWRMDPQIMGHIYAWRAEGYDVKGVLMNAIQFNRIPAPISTKCRTHKMEQKLCWTAHVKQNMFEVQPSPEVYAAWLTEQRQNAMKYRSLLLQQGGNIPQEGLVNGTCNGCHLNEFCYKGRTAFELLTVRDAPAWITRSGIYRSEAE